MDDTTQADRAKLEETLKQVRDNSYIHKCISSTEKEDFAKSAEEFRYQKEPFFFEDEFRRDGEGGLEYLNQTIISKQRSVLPSMLKNIGAALISGKPLKSVGIPIEACYSKSSLERMASNLSYAPQMLGKAAESKDPYEQFCMTIAHWIASSHFGAYQENPIEPIVGETYQGKVGGFPVYFEQITPVEDSNIMCFLLAADKFRVTGNWQMCITMYPNSLKGQLLGVSETHFLETGAKIYFQLPAGTISGTVMGKRKFDVTGKFYAWDYENQFFAELEGNPPAEGFFSKKTTSNDFIKGKIWKAKKTFMQKLKDNVTKKGGVDLKYKESVEFDEEKDKVEASWLDTVKIGDRVYWKFGEVKPHKVVSCDKLLPSDSTFRPDIILKKMGNDPEAEEARQQLKISEINDLKAKK